MKDGDESMINKMNLAIVLAVGLLLLTGNVVGQPLASQDENYTFLNLTKFVEENPIDPNVGSLTEQAVLGKNASINFAQVAPGNHFGAHYHTASAEIGFIIQGQGNATINGEVRPVKPGDLIYMPPGTVLDYEALGTENLIVLVIFAAPLDEKDRHFV
jgi:quercetin dioxygenase-like cupin family protein